jgi:hypothetical protein
LDATPRKKRTPSFSFRLKLPKAIRELENSLAEVQDRAWEEGDRRRVCDIAFSLAGAFQVEELREAAVMARSLGCLMKLSKEQITPIEAAFREKLQEILSFLRDTADQALTGT